MKKKLWNNIKYNIENIMPLNKVLINKYLNKFFKEIIYPKFDENKDQHFTLIFRIELENREIKSVTKALKLNINDLQILVEYINDKIGLVTDSYFNSPIKSIILSYGFRKGIIESSIKSIENLKDITKSYHVFYNHKLPLSLTPEGYGIIKHQKDNLYFINIKNNIDLVLEQEGNKHSIKYYKGPNLMYNWLDIINLNENSLTREIGKTTLFYKDGEVLWVKVLKKSKPITIKKTSPNLNKSLLTLDLETIANNNNNFTSLSPYLLSWYDGKNNKATSYFIENNNIKKMILRAINDICIRKYNYYNIYVHNLAKFDAIFLLKYLSELGKINTIIHNGKIIEISFKYKNKYTIKFRDSYLILLSSLKDLSESFKIDDKKGIFPIFLNDISYKGSLPNKEYFNPKVTLDDYNNYKEQFSQGIKSGLLKKKQLNIVNLIVFLYIRY